jgi:hypothetical protein
VHRLQGRQGSEVVAVETRPDPSLSKFVKVLIELPESENG